MRRTMLVVAMGASAVLAGCGGAAPSTPQGAAVAAAAPTSGASTSTPTGPPSPTCANLTGAQAAKKWVAQVPTYDNENAGGYAWDLPTAETASYSPCAPLSWIVLPIHGPTASSPYQVMLFHAGQFVGTATTTPQAYHPDITRVSPAAIAVTYTFARDEIVAAASGRARSTFTWDEGSKRVVRTGTLPPADDEESGAASPTPASAAPRGLPAGATPITTIRRKHESYETETAVIRTPSKNIGCDFTATTGGCGVQSYISEHKYPEDFVGPPWWFSLDEANPTPQSKGDAPYYDYTDVPAQIVQYGQTVYYGHYACTSTQANLRCWNTETGHGAEMAREGYRSF